MRKNSAELRYTRMLAFSRPLPYRAMLKHSSKLSYSCMHAV